MINRTKVLGLCLVALFAMSGFAAAQASATEFAWHVNGSKLEAGQEKELTTKAKTNQVLKGEVFFVKVEITCKEVKAAAGSKIIGGVPGTSSETVEYSGCTVQSPSGCTIKGGTITTKPLKDEIVEGVGSSAGKVLLLLTPKEGTTFAEPKLEGGFFCQTVPVKGSVLAEANPQGTEVTTGVLKFEPANGKEYTNSKKETKKAGLTAGGNPSTVSGEVEAELKPSEKFGAF